jgi:hypothetical protein
LAANVKDNFGIIFFSLVFVYPVVKSLVNLGKHFKLNLPKTDIFEIIILMFSYLSSVKTLIEKPVYDRGMVAYLEGGLSSFTELTLDYWREYKYSGKDEYFIKIPLLHLALNSDKFSLASQVISELVTCTCPYFLEYGICKHIVAVCANLDKEFNPEHSLKKMKIENKHGDTLLDKIFEAEKTRQIREFTANLEMYLNSSKTTDFKWLETFVIALNNQPNDYQATLKNFHDIVTRSLKDFDLEIKIIKILTKSLIFGNKIWWDFWKIHLPEIHKNNLIKVWADIWEMRILDLLNDFKTEIDDYLADLDQAFKNKLLSILQINFKHNPHYWLEFVFVAKNYEWVEQNLLNLDPKTLIQACTVWPDKIDEIEPHILEKLKIWLDFLQANDYNEVVKIFNLWLKTLGGGEYYQQAILYLKETHKKKRTLINRILKPI